MISKTLTSPALTCLDRDTNSRMVTPQLATAERTSSCPASIRLAISTSPFRVRREMVPISRRYNRTGSSMETESDFEACASSPTSPFLPSLEAAAIFSPFKEVSTIAISFSLKRAMRSSICSGVTTSEGRTSLTSS